VAACNTGQAVNIFFGRGKGNSLVTLWRLATKKMAEEGSRSGGVKVQKLVMQYMSTCFLQHMI
jgi:hypothetical protein